MRFIYSNKLFSFTINSRHGRERDKINWLYVLKSKMHIYTSGWLQILYFFPFFICALFLLSKKENVKIKYSPDQHMLKWRLHDGQVYSKLRIEVATKSLFQIIDMWLPRGSHMAAKLLQLESKYTIRLTVMWTTNQYVPIRSLSRIQQNSQPFHSLYISRETEHPLKEKCSKNFLYPKRTEQK